VCGIGVLGWFYVYVIVDFFQVVCAIVGRVFFLRIEFDSFTSYLISSV